MNHLLVLVLVLDWVVWIQTRGGRRAGGRSGSLSQCALTKASGLSTKMALLVELLANAPRCPLVRSDMCLTWKSHTPIESAQPVAASRQSAADFGFEDGGALTRRRYRV